MFKVATIADIHFNALPAEEMYKQLEKSFLKYLENHSVDMVVIAGDLYDSIISFNSRAAHLSTEFIKRLIEVSARNDIRYIRIIKGTMSHDNNQLTNLKIFESNESVDFKIHETVASECIDGNEVLFIPEEYMKDVSEFYKEFTDKKYDMIFGHGMFKETSFRASKQESAVTLSGAPVFDSKVMCDMSRGPILFGHIHTSCSIRNKITYVGSFSRWVFGEEEKKGFVVTVYNKDDETFVNEFIENDLAEAYDTITVVDIDKYVSDPKPLIEKFEALRKGKLRIIVVIEGDKDYSYIVNFLKEYYGKSKEYKLKITDKTMVKKETEAEDRLNNLMGKYGFVFDDKIAHAEKISRFIKVRDGKDISVEKIKEKLNLS